MDVLHLRKSFSKLTLAPHYDQVLEMERQGVNNHIVANERVNAEERPFENVTIVPWPSIWSPRRIGYRLLESLRLERYLESSWRDSWPGAKEVVERIGPDVLHAHFGRAGVKAVPLAEQLGLPLVVSFYGYDVSQLPQEEAWRRAYRKIWSEADAIVGISNHMCSSLTSIGAPEEKVEKVSLGVDLEKFEFSDPTHSFDGQTVQCLHVGRLVEKKAPLLLARAFHRASQQIGEECRLHLTIAGGGPLMGDLRNLLERLDIEDQVSLLGSVPHQRVRELMQNTHLYTQHCVTASNGDQEGQGITFVEASATGRPIVSTRHNGIPDVVVDGETGVLVEEGDVEEMGAEIARLACSPDRWVQLGNAGRKHIGENFDLSTQVRKQIAIYERVLN